MTISTSSSDPIEERLDLKIAEFRKSATKAKRITYALRIPVLILGAVSAVILGYQIPDPEYQSFYQTVSRNTALTISATITVLMSLASFWDIETHWLRNRLKLAQLETLREEYVMLKLANKNGREEIERILNRYFCIVDTAPDWDEALIKTKRGQSHSDT